LTVQARRYEDQSRARSTLMPDDPAAETGQSKAKVFISYSRKDMAFADRLDGELKNRGFEPLIDRSDIYVFEDWWQRIQNLIVQADTVIFVLSPDSASSHICQREVEFAASRSKRLAPIELRPVDPAIVPDALERLNFECFEDPQVFDRNVDRLVDALQADIHWIRKHTEFGAQAHNWAEAGQASRSGLCLRSPMLEEAERWIASRPANAPLPSRETQAFIAESRRRASRRRDALLGALTGGLIVALALAAVAILQRWAAEDARATAQAESARAKEALETVEQLANALVLDIGQDPQFRSLPPDLRRRIFERAIGGYGKVIAINPADPMTHNDRGNAYLGEAMFADAIADYDEAIKLNPNYAIAYSNRCWARVLANEQLPQALTDCDKAIAIQSDNYRALDNRAYTYLRLGEVDKSIADFSAALKIESASATSLYGRGLAKLRKNDIQGAKADIEAAVKIRPTVAEDLARYGIE